MPDSRMLHNQNKSHPFPELGQASGNIHWNYDALIRAQEKEPLQDHPSISYNTKKARRVVIRMV